MRARYEGRCVCARPIGVGDGVTRLPAPVTITYKHPGQPLYARVGRPFYKTRVVRYAHTECAAKLMREVDEGRTEFAKVYREVIAAQRDQKEQGDG